MRDTYFESYKVKPWKPTTVEYEAFKKRDLELAKANILFLERTGPRLATVNHHDTLHTFSTFDAACKELNRERQ
jgi:hypothetical protein